jgi:hypothetical protein
MNQSVRWIARNLQDGTALGLGFPLRHISGLLGRKYHVTTIKHAGKVYIRPKSSDAETFIQIFRKREYDLAAQGQHLILRF